MVRDTDVPNTSRRGEENGIKKVREAKSEPSIRRKSRRSQDISMGGKVAV